MSQVIARPLTRVALSAVFLTVVFGLGLLAGIQFAPSLSPGSTAHDEHDDHAHAHDELASTADAHDEHAEEDHDDHLALSRQAFENLGLRMGEAPQGDYWRSMLVPAEVVELPGRSEVAVSAPVQGVVETVDVLTGEAIRAGQKLFTLRLTDEALADAQSKLLATLTAEDVAKREVERLTPLIESGAVPGTRKRELQYEIQQLESKRQTLRQELLGRGLPQRMIDRVISGRQLATTMEIVAPPQVDEGAEEPAFSLEELQVHPGKSVARGADLCRLAYHRELQIQGAAFDEDVSALNRVSRMGWPLRAEALHGREGDGEVVVRDNLQLTRVDNHYQEQTRTVRFFVALHNEVEHSRTDDAGRLFQQWRFRPGQRLHLRLPVEQWQRQWTLPADAVVVDGPNVFVFAEHHDHEDEHAEPAAGDVAEVTHNVSLAETDGGLPPASPLGVPDEHAAHPEHDEVYIELEPVPVRMLHRDDRTVVIADDGQLTPGMRIALNQAYKLHLALQMQAAGGGGHHHHHDH
ncbi:MAG: efflux RND transporter periplasmic adaptor subunit [Planctomycetales bacterium]|nr:efflux RND transporter periplasmic adaptor subunit [Planctomycetales bacterium]